MLVRVCLVLCAGILLASANPVPQDTVDQALNEQPKQSLEVPTTEPHLNENETVESDSGTDEPPNEGTADQSEDSSGIENESESDSESEGEENGSERESDRDKGSESNSGTNESSSNDNADEENKSAHESSAGDNSNVSDLDDEEEHDSESKDTSNNNSEENNSELEDNESNKGHQNENNDGSENEHDIGSENDESGSDSKPNGSDDEGFDEGHEKPEDEVSLSIVQSNGVILRVYKIVKDNEDIICQEINNKGMILESRCFATHSFFLFGGGEFVSVFSKIINGQNFLCQEIISYINGPIQILCTSNGRYFYQNSQVLHLSSSHFGHLDINLPFY